MKSYIKNSLYALGAVALLTACSEDTWNDHLDGFEQPNQFTEKKALNCTLTGADYQTISTLAANKALAEADGESEELAAIGTNGYFTTANQARKYIPAFLINTNLPYYSLNDGSTVDVTYDLLPNLPEIVSTINSGVESYTLTEADYKSVWGSDEDYIEGFAPMKPAAGNLPGVLKAQLTDCQAGDYAVVTYNESSVNPIFGSVGEGGGSQAPEWEETEVLNDIAVGDEVTVMGYVTAIQARGFVLTDKGGSILCYQAGYDISKLMIGQQVTLSGKITSFNTGYQFDLSACEVEFGEVVNYTYPTPRVYTGEMMDEAVQRTGNFICEYVTFRGTVSINDTHINFNVPGATTSQGSGYQVPDFIMAQLQDGADLQITGYFSSVSSGKFFNVAITSVEATSSAIRFNAPATPVSTNAINALYQFDGSKWSVASNAVVLQTADYLTMGQTYSNLSGNTPDQFLPIFLAQNYPFAQEDDVMTVVYRYYNGSATNWKATQYVRTNGVWTRNSGSAVDKFQIKNGVFAYNPSVEITLPYSRNTDPSYSYYMSCCEYVLDNIVKPTNPDATLTTATPYIDYRGNAEFYSGASAYYGNVDVRASTAKNHCPEGAYTGMSDEEITLLIKKRFCTETFPYALKVHNPNATPVEGLDVTYTVNITAYTGAAEPVQIVYKVVGPGQFEYLSSTWVEAGQDADWK